jgi:hypothetical protein
MSSRDNTAALSAVLAVWTLLLSPSTARAWLSSIVDCEQMVSGSSVVVLARPISRTRDTGEGQDADPRDAAGFPSVWVETTFRVTKVLQGRITAATFVLHHLREPTLAPGKDGRVPVLINGPPLVWFNPSRPADQRQMVLFLVREPDGRYAPYPDQTAGAGSIYPLDATKEALTAPAACGLSPVHHGER